MNPISSLNHMNSSDQCELIDLKVLIKHFHIPFFFCFRPLASIVFNLYSVFIYTVTILIPFHALIKFFMTFITNLNLVAGKFK